ncbi:hypothetical protein BKA83DRAFT_4277664 [Pisolithus microcarpus]|nr:hypothetical protein BKA83DRAFT_4277173 [Pisolithus microcarpus]KAI6022341.1 hypothetical protein BKA83DRAFT_4277664 [Pisolithus microcarpus]
MSHIDPRLNTHVSSFALSCALLVLAVAHAHPSYSGPQATRLMMKLSMSVLLAENDGEPGEEDGGKSIDEPCSTSGSE